jgi:hypothetical protein
MKILGQIREGTSLNNTLIIGRAAPTHPSFSGYATRLEVTCLNNLRFVQILTIALNDHIMTKSYYKDNLLKNEYSFEVLLKELQM